MPLTPEERLAQRVVGGIIRTGGARLSREQLMIWRSKDAGEFGADAAEVTEHLEALGVPYTVAITRGPTKHTKRQLGFRVDVAWDDLGTLERWLPSLRPLIDAVETPEGTPPGAAS